jgi:hypothetical protein
MLAMGFLNQKPPPTPGTAMKIVDTSGISGHSESELYASPTLVNRGKRLTVDRLRYRRPWNCNQVQVEAA